MRSPASRAGAALLAAAAALTAAACAAQTGVDAAPQGNGSAAASRTPLPPEAGMPEGPSGTAGAGASSGHDAVGHAVPGASTLAGFTATSPAIPPGRYAEVTALDSGRTILVLIADGAPDGRAGEIGLSAQAAQALGVAGQLMAPVRVRAVTASTADMAALRAGQMVTRLDSPPALLRALRRQLPSPRSADAAERPRVAVSAAPRQAAARVSQAARFVVQVAALSSETRAAALARSLGGRALPAGGLWRVRLGPFADMPSAQRARDGAVRRGYGDASILPAD